MKVLLFFFGFWLCGLGATSLYGQDFNYQNDFQSILARTNTPSDSLYHEKLARRFSKNDSSLSDYAVLALLINFTSNQNYAPYSILKTEDRIVNLVQKFQYERAIELSDSILEFQPYNQQVLLNKAFSYYRLKKNDSADYYKYQFNRIMDAMAFSGSGSFKEPIFSLGSKDSENYIFERLARQIMTIGSGIDSAGNFIDIIEITDYQTDTTTIHFQIQHAVDRLINTRNQKH